MLIRDGNSERQWAALRLALRGRNPRFIRRESLPDCTIAWAEERLPDVLLSPDVYELLERAIPGSFTDHVLAPIRARGAA